MMEIDIYQRGYLMDLKLIENNLLELDSNFVDISNINKERIISFINSLRSIIFPKCFKREHTIKQTYIELSEILGFLGLNNDYIIVDKFFSELVNIKQILLKDLEMYITKDPSAYSKEEIIISNNSFYAVFIYRIAHLLHQLKLQYIPKILSEHAHSVTGIDIHPGCIIGEYFFIDHGTGIVIGETTIIGNYVSIYQGVTLGAKSLKEGSLLKGIKRHPTIEDNVVIYANATILGGSTVIKENSIIPGNAFILKSN